MSRTPRPQHRALWHLMNRGVERRRIFEDDQDRSRFLNIVERAATRFDWEIEAHCLMPNHWHMSVETPMNTVSRGVHLIDGWYAQSFNRRWKRVGPLFQGRAKGVLVERETHLDEVSRYIVLNPVRADLVRSPADWKWSSYRATAGLEPRPAWLHCERILERFAGGGVPAAQAYVEHVAAGIGAPSPWDEVVGQICLGSEEFVENVERLLAEFHGAPGIPDSATNLVDVPLDDVLASVLVAFDVTPSSFSTRGDRPATCAFAALAQSRARATLAQIAAAMGVSIATASRRAARGHALRSSGDARFLQAAMLLDQARGAPARVDLLAG